MQRRFVILSLQRSGSNMLRSILDAHPDARCFGELMRKTPKDMPPYRGALRNLNRVDPKFKKDAVRFRHPHEFLAQVMRRFRKASILGFKLMLDQHPDLMADLIADPKYQKIFLYRGNHLATYSSAKIAEATGQGNAKHGMEIKRAKVKFSKRDFQRFVKRREEAFAQVREQLERAGGTHMEIEYLELINGDGIDRVLEFLELDPAQDLAPETLKRNPSNLLERFENPDDVAATLEEMGFENWSVETLQKSYLEARPNPSSEQTL